MQSINIYILYREELNSESDCVYNCVYNGAKHVTGSAVRFHSNTTFAGVNKLVPDVHNPEGMVRTT